MTEFAILDWLYWLDEKLQVQIFYDTFEKRYSETTMIDVVKICSQKTILEYEEIKEIFWNEML